MPQNKTSLRNPKEYTRYTRRQYSYFQMVFFTQSYVDMIAGEIGRRSSVRNEGSNGWMSDLVIDADIAEWHRRVSSRLQKDPTFLDTVFAELERSGNQAVEYIQSVEIHPRVSNQSLFEITRVLVEKCYQHWKSLWITFVIGEAGSELFTTMAERYLSASDFSAALEEYSIPERKAHLLIIADYFLKEKDISRRVLYLQEQYPWIFMTDFFVAETKKEDYLEFARVQSKTATHRAVRHIKLPDEARSAVKIYQKILYLKDKRDEYRRKIFYYSQPLVREVMRRFGISRDDLWHIEAEEFVSLESQKRELLKEVNRRKKGYVYESDGEHVLYLSGKAATDVFIESANVGKVSEFRGIVGCKGKVTGKVQVIRASGAVREFKADNVLVAITTNPDYIVAMKKAIAFVTDDGGITSHAAIMARELKKPCIIGTKIATKVLKDGDLVEVDAERGIVTIIEESTKFNESKK